MRETFEHASVRFSCSEEALEGLVLEAEERCRGNLKDFAGRRVLIEGGGYHKVWLETQPMGGAMYGKRDLLAAWNNQKIFMDHQRADGRLPGSIALEEGRLLPQFNKFQGFCFPAPALDVYYLTGRDPEYLDQLYDVLRRFDRYLWQSRDTDGDGCLESFCRFDTGEDDAPRYGDAPDAWEAEEPPKDREVVPMASMDFMSYSYAAREAMGQIAHIQGREEEEKAHLRDAAEVKKRIHGYLWEEERGALFDRDRFHRRLPTLTHNNLRVMHWNAMERADAQRFVREHLLNPEEFWTPMPLPSVAANDPLFRNRGYNSWSGQCQALTYQRAIRALENYGYFGLIPLLGEKFLSVLCSSRLFVQQTDPFTMVPSKEGEDGYGPAILSCLEYVSRMYGIHLCREKIIWGTSCLRGERSVYEQRFGERVYRLENKKEEARGYIGERQVFSCPRNRRIETDLTGEVQAVYAL